MSLRFPALFAILLATLLILPGISGAWELRLTSDTADQQNPAVSGTTVVWQDDRNGNWDIYLYDGLTGQTRRLTDDPGKQINPQIAGRYVVWEDYRNSDAQNNNPDIYLLDLDTGDEMVVNSELAIFGGYECNPSISDESGFVVVTWIEKAAGMSEQGRVFYRYIDGSEKWSQAYQDSNTQTSPWVSGQKLVWTDTDLGGLYFRYLPDPETRILQHLPNTSAIKEIRSSDNRIVWSEWDPDRFCWNVRLCEMWPDLQNGTTSWLSAQDPWQEHPAIDGDLVVWSDIRNGNPDIYLDDLATNQKRALVVVAGDQIQPAIDGELVAFTDSRSGARDIYLTGARSTTPLPGVVAIEGGAGAPQDLNGDGLCEDVNGNGRSDFADVVLYFNNMDWIGAYEPTFRFDCNGNGRIDFADVVWLFNHL